MAKVDYLILKRRGGADDSVWFVRTTQNANSPKAAIDIVTNDFADGREGGLEDVEGMWAAVPTAHFHQYEASTSTELLLKPVETDPANGNQGKLPGTD